MGELPDNLRTAVFDLLCDVQYAGPLKAAALSGRLGDWTRSITAVTAQAFGRLGFNASAKGHTLDALPVSRSEYLSLDVVAFPAGGSGWSFPVAAVELENSPKDATVAYSLWKVMCIRAELRAVFCYRKDEDQANALVRMLRDEVVAAMTLESRVALDGETLVVVGTRGEAATFPYGFFKWWRLDRNTGQFNLL